MIRKATKHDLEQIVPLMLQSEPVLFEYVFMTPTKEAAGFLEHSFVSGKGFFGYKHQYVLSQEGRIMTTITCYPAYLALKLLLEQVFLIFGYYRREAFSVLRRSLSVATLYPRIPLKSFYLANAASRPGHRGKGYFSTMLAHFVRKAHTKGYRLSLDVSMENPYAQRLYESLGFKVTRQSFHHGKAPVKGIKRMLRDDC